MTRRPRRDVVEGLQAMGRRPVPPPDPGFVAATEARLRRAGALHELEGPAPAGRLLAFTPQRAALAAVAAAAAVFVGLAVVSSPPGQDVGTSGPAAPPPTVTTVPPATSTTLPPDPVLPPPVTDPDEVRTTPTSARPSPPATKPADRRGGARPPATSKPDRGTTPPPTKQTRPEPTTTTSPPTTAADRPPPDTAPPEKTTTTRPARESLRLACGPASREGSQGVACGWSESSSPDFGGYQLHRRADGGETRVVFSTRDRSQLRHFDTTVSPGSRYAYVLKALDRQGRVLATSNVSETTCC